MNFELTDCNSKFKIQNSQFSTKVAFDFSGGDGFAFVVRFAAFADAKFELGASAREIKLERHEGIAFLLHAAL